MSNVQIINITGVPKPRMSQQDKWKKRPCVLRYWAFKDAIRQELKEIPQPCTLWFKMPMPKSWSAKKRLQMANKPHLVRPDKDNLEKGLTDALYEEDSHLWNTRVIKTWIDSPVGQIIVIDETNLTTEEIYHG